MLPPSLTLSSLLLWARLLQEHAHLTAWPSSHRPPPPQKVPLTGCYLNSLLSAPPHSEWGWLGGCLERGIGPLFIQPVLYLLVSALCPNRGRVFPLPPLHQAHPHEFAFAFFCQCGVPWLSIPCDGTGQGGGYIAFPWSLKHTLTAGIAYTGG